MTNSTKAPSPPSSFEQLVHQAKASETRLSAARLDQMFERLEARLPAPSLPLDQPRLNASTSGSTSGTRLARLGKTSLGKALLGGAGVLAAAAFMYSATDDREAPPSLPVDGVVSDVVDLDDKRVAPVLGMESEAPSNGVNQHATPAGESENGETAGTTPSKSKSSTQVRSARGPRRDNSRVSVAQEPDPTPVAPQTVEVSSEPKHAEPAPVSSPPAVKPVLDTSLAQLERAEKALRSGDPGLALTVLAQPVVPSLSSRAEALRAVALCQSGQQGAGVRLAQQHLARNPSSPYEKRLVTACGRDL